MRKFSAVLSMVVLSAFVLSIPVISFAQDKEVRKSLHASVTQNIGVDTEITFDFSRPGVKGRKIWGELVPYGMNPANKYSNEKTFPWRVGANENTTIKFTSDLMIEGKKIAAGHYSIHMIPSEKEWVVIFNKKNDLWGSYGYDENEDALRINITPVKAEHQEWLIFGFENLAGTKATAFMHWEKVKIPFSVEVAVKE